MSEYVSRRLDGELSEVEHARLTVHLSGCAACRQRAATIDEATRVLRMTPPEQLDFPVVLPSGRRPALRAMQAASVAAAAVVALGLASVFRSGQQPNVSGGATSADTRPAYLQSPEYELRIMQRAVPSHTRPRLPFTQ